MKWSNKKPTEEGIYWHVEKWWIDGVEYKTFGPSVVIVEFDYKGDIELMEMGSDCPGGIVFDENEDNVMIYERSEPREMPFSWESKEKKERMINDRVIRKTEHWLMKIEEPKLPWEDI